MSTVETHVELTPAEWAAMQVVSRAAKAYRDQLDTITAHPIDLMVRIKGELTVGLDGFSITKRKPSPEDVLAFVLENVPDLTRADLIVELSKMGAAGGLPDLTEGYVATARKLIDGLAEKKEGARKGALRGSFQLGVVEQSTLAPAVQVKLASAIRLITLEDDDKVESPSATAKGE